MKKNEKERYGKLCSLQTLGEDMIEQLEYRIQDIRMLPTFEEKCQ